MPCTLNPIGNYTPSYSSNNVPPIGLILYDNSRSGILRYNGSSWDQVSHEFGLWEYPNKNNLKKFVSMLATNFDNKKTKPFITPEDQILLEVLQNVDPELLLENKEIMRKFETMYRFFRSLV